MNPKSAEMSGVSSPGSGVAATSSAKRLSLERHVGFYPTLERLKEDSLHVRCRESTESYAKLPETYDNQQDHVKY